MEEYGFPEEEKKLFSILIALHPFSSKLYVKFKKQSYKKPLPIDLNKGRRKV